jgi:hypothetical protein
MSAFSPLPFGSLISAAIARKGLTAISFDFTAHLQQAPSWVKTRLVVFGCLQIQVVPDRYSTI